MRLACAIFLLMLGSVASAAPEVTRVLKTFDFEERRLGNEEPLPMHWQKVSGPGLPHYVNGHLSTDRHRGGEYSFRFDLNGGGLVYRYDPGRIQVQTGAHYRVEAWCQTTVLPNARARVSAYLADALGHELPGTLRHSDLYAARSEGQPWKKLSVEVTDDSPDAVSLVIELELLQPMHYATSRLGEHALFTQDIHGSAWFDDVSVSQVPEVRLRTDHPGNIFTRGEPVRLQAIVNDRFTDDLQAQILVRNAEGKTVYQRSGAVEIDPRLQASDGRKRMLIELPGLSPGWYETSVSMTSHGQPLGTQSISLVLLPDDGRKVAPDGRFGFIATSLPFEAWEGLPRILPMLSAGRVKLAVWSAQGDVESSRGAEFDRLLVMFQEQGITPTACLLEPPPSITEPVGEQGWPALLKAQRSDWQPQLAYFLSRHANHLSRWQIGPDGSEAFVNDPKMRQVYRKIYNEFASLIDKPDLAMPWPAWYEVSGDLPATIALSVPTSVLPSQLPLYVDELRRHKDRHLSLSLELLGRDQYGRDVQIRDLAQRVIYALAADAKRIDLPLPLTALSDEEGATEQPLELFLVMRTLVSTLSGAQYKGRVAIADGVEAFLFDRSGQGILALWDRGSTAGVKELALNLGERPQSVDLWGNIAPLPRASGENRGRVALKIGPMPMFLVDIDGPQAQLRASVAIDRPLLESSFRPHERRIRFSNPYNEAISGSLHLQAPDGWTMDPPTFNFNLNPGETFDRPITLQFPYNSFAGPKILKCDFYLQGDRNPHFAVPITLTLGLSDVGMQAIALRDKGGLFVQQLITNYGDSPIDYTAFVMCAGQPRQERLVSNLAPGASTIKRFRFEKISATEVKKVRVGLKELEGTRILNDEIEVR